jgi:hypothetical protein
VYGAAAVVASGRARGRIRSAERDDPASQLGRFTLHDIHSRPHERTPGTLAKGVVVSEHELERLRKEAKRLVRDHRAGEGDARARAAAVLGDRAERRFALADAQFVLARERGHGSWTELRRALESPLAALVRQEVGEVVVASGLAYGDGEPVDVLVRKRLHRYLLTDRGRAVAKSGKPRGWREPAEWAAEPMNVDRNGVVFVPAVEGRDLDDLVRRLADASRAVHEALLVLDE